MKKKINILVFSVVLVLLLPIVVLIYNKISADEITTIVLKGRVYEDLSEPIGSIGNMNKPAHGATILYRADPASESCDSQSCSSCQKEFSATADSNGYYEIEVDKPCDCPYRVIVGGGDSDGYNSKDYGYKWLKEMEMSSFGNGFETYYSVNKETDMMYSGYMGHLYPYSYYDSYHLSQWDNHYIRNYINTNKLLSPSTAEGASFKIPVKAVFGAWPMQDTTIESILTVYPVSSTWTNDPPSLGRALTKTEFNFSSKTKDVELNFPEIGLSDLSLSAKNLAYVNGFMIDFEFKTEGVDPKDLELWRNINPDIIIPASELSGGGVISPITYSDVEEIDPVCLRPSGSFPETVSELNGVAIPGGGSGGISHESHIVTDGDPTKNPQSVKDGIMEHLSVTRFRMNCPCEMAICKMSAQEWTPAEGGGNIGQGTTPMGSVPVDEEPWIMNARWSPAPARGTKVLITSTRDGITRAVVAVAGYEIGPSASSGNLLGAQPEVLAALDAGHGDNVTFSFLKDQNIAAGTKYAKCDLQSDETSSQSIQKSEEVKEMAETQENGTITSGTTDSANEDRSNAVSDPVNDVNSQETNKLSYDGDWVRWMNGNAEIVGSIDNQEYRNIEMVPINTQISPELEVLPMWDRIVNIFNPQPIEITTQYNVVEDGWVYWEDGNAYSPLDQVAINENVDDSMLQPIESPVIYQDSWWDRVKYLFDPILDMSAGYGQNIEMLSCPPVSF